MLTIPPDLDFESSSTTTNQYFEAFPLQLSHICGAFKRDCKLGRMSFQDALTDERSVASSAFSHFDFSARLREWQEDKTGTQDANSTIRALPKLQHTYTQYDRHNIRNH